MRTPIPGRRLGAALALVSLLGTGAKAQSAPSPFRFERSLQPGGKGPNRLVVDVPLLSGAASPRLADLRLYDAAGREVAYLQVFPPAPEPRWKDGRISAIAATKDSSGFELDLGRAEHADRLRLAGLPAPFLKRFRLEASGDRSRWTLLVAEGTLFDLPDEQLRQTDIGFPAGEYRYLRVTWDDRASARVPAPHVQAVKASVRLAEPLAAPALLRAPVEFQRLSSEPGRSRFRIRLPGPRLPVATVELTVGPGHLLRPARVLEARLSGGELLPALLGSATLRRAERGGLVAADLRIPISAPEGREIELVVEDGNNPALALSGVSVEFLPLPWIYFESATGEPLVARFGNDTMAAPRYDLEAVRDHVLENVARAPAAEARWGESHGLRPAATVAQTTPLPAVGAPMDAAKFRYSRKIPAAGEGLVALQLDAAVLAHTSAGLEDLRIANAEARQVPYLLEKRDEQLSLPLALETESDAAFKKTGPASPRQSRYQLTLPYATLPESRLVLATTARVFERRVSVQVRRPAADPRSEPRVETVAEASWRHADPETDPPQLPLQLPRLGDSQFTVVVDEGDNAPLPISAARLLLPSYRVRFFNTPGGELTLYYGQAGLAAPQYDLALLAPRLVGVSGQERALPPDEASGAAPGKPRSPTQLFWGVLIAAVFVLLFLLVRLLRSRPETAT